MDLDSAVEMVERALARGRPANGYLVVGGVRGQALQLAERLSTRLVGAESVERMRAHPDVHWLRPEKKSRIISVEAVHERLVDAVATTSYSGGWKVGIVVGADCLNPQSANAFLKTLEEPPPRTVFFLLTDSPERLLPTIVSRCQRIDLPDARRPGLDEPWRTATLKILADEANAAGFVERAAMAGRLAGVLAELQARAEELVREDLDAAGTDSGEELEKDEVKALVSSRYREFRSDFCVTLSGWFRDVAATCAAGASAPLVNAEWAETVRARAARLSRAQAFRNVDAADDLARSFERNVQDAAALGRFADRITLR